MARVAREFADNAERSGGRSMILLGAGTNHWFHSDTTYRAILALVTLFVARGPAPFAGIRSTPPILLLAGGALGTFYVTTSIFLVPRIGAAALMALVIAGQLLAAAAIDHFGLFGVAMRELSVGRAAGLAAVALGALLVRFC